MAISGRRRSIINHDLTNRNHIQLSVLACSPYRHRHIDLSGYASLLAQSHRDMEIIKIIKHSKLPFIPSSKGCIFHEASDQLIADAFDTDEVTAAENAKFIALACNSHYKIPEDLLATYREYMEAAVTLGEIDENTAIYVGDILQNIVRDTTVEASPRED